MRRAPPLAQLSPSLIKHFAFATVALTGLLAVFASGEDWGTAAQIKAVNDRNQLETAEVSKFGAKKLAAKIELRDGGPPPAFNSDVLIEHHRTSAAYSPSASTGGARRRLCRRVGLYQSRSSSTRRRFTRGPTRGAAYSRDRNQTSPRQAADRDRTAAHGPTDRSNYRQIDRAVSWRQRRLASASLAPQRRAGYCADQRWFQRRGIRVMAALVKASEAAAITLSASGAQNGLCNPGSTLPSRLAAASCSAGRPPTQKIMLGV